MELSHQPVLLAEALEALVTNRDGIYVDATFGRGGHTGALLQALGAGAQVLALDRDPAAEQVAQRRFGSDARFAFRRCPFSELGNALTVNGWQGAVQGVLLDLGVSSPQLDDPARGFSFRYDGPLDMRMDPTTGTSAAAWLARIGTEDLARVLRDYGEERFARRVARAIVKARAEAPIVTTGRLAAIVAAAVPTREPGQHPATRSFQALRIVVNHELDEINAVLPQAVAALAPGGRLVVISFHSLEDRQVKRFLRRESKPPELPPGLPVPVSAQPRARLRLLGRRQRASADECRRNPRARSAILRAAERVA